MTKREFIKDMIKNFDEFSSSDLQGIVEARCIQTGEDEEKLLAAIYKGANA